MSGDLYGVLMDLIGCGLSEGGFVGTMFGAGGLIGFPGAEAVFDFLELGGGDDGAVLRGQDGCDFFPHVLQALC